MAFHWRADDRSTLNAGLVALFFFMGSGPVLLRNSRFLWFFRGRGGGGWTHDDMSPHPSVISNSITQKLRVHGLFYIFFRNRRTLRGSRHLACKNCCQRLSWAKISDPHDPKWVLIWVLYGHSICIWRGFCNRDPYVTHNCKPIGQQWNPHAKPIYGNRVCLVLDCPWNYPSKWSFLEGCQTCNNQQMKFSYTLLLIQRFFFHFWLVLDFR